MTENAQRFADTLASAALAHYRQHFPSEAALCRICALVIQTGLSTGLSVSEIAREVELLEAESELVA
jgi:hypothetical protein